MARLQPCRQAQDSDAAFTAGLLQFARRSTGAKKSCRTEPVGHLRDGSMFRDTKQWTEIRLQADFKTLNFPRRNPGDGRRAARFHSWKGN
jgi:hypothetical protein